LFATASTTSLPLWSVRLLIVIPCCSKNPLRIPRSSGSPFAIGSVTTVIVSFPPPFASGAPAAGPVSATTATRAATRNALGRLARLRA
jgi:hypothetical protein